METGVERAFEFQAELCRQMGSELSARLLDRALADLRAGGALAALVSGWELRDAVLGGLPLRVLAAVHRRALAGEAPEVAHYLPTTNGTPSYPEVCDAFSAELARGDLGDQLERFPQTNEVGRAAALLGAFLTVAARSGASLELLEIGASAGLNLNWPRFRFELGAGELEAGELGASALGGSELADWAWGPADSPAVVRLPWRGGRPPGPDASALRVVSSRGCDLSPIDVTDDEEALRLCSYVWADQVERLARLRGAISLARRHPVALERARARDWLAERVATPAPLETARIVYHSSVWLYLPEDEQARVRELIEAAGARATAAAPLAWVRLEHEDVNLTLRLSSWPGERDERLATASPHGLWVHWLGPTA